MTKAITTIFRWAICITAIDCLALAYLHTLVANEPSPIVEVDSLVKSNCSEEYEFTCMSAQESSKGLAECVPIEWLCNNQRECSNGKVSGDRCC